MTNVKTMEDVQRLREEVEDKAHALLRSKGWRYTCSTPGSRWLWEKKLPDGRTVLVDSRSAEVMQENMDNDL
jgi:hypothetical protein